MVVFSPVQAVEIVQINDMQIRCQGGDTAQLDKNRKNELSGDDNSRFTNSAGKPMVTSNTDGTFTVQKGLPNGNSKDTNANEGLVIPPQVITPIFSAPDKKQ